MHHQLVDLLSKRPDGSLHFACAARCILCLSEIVQPLGPWLANVHALGDGSVGNAEDLMHKLQTRTMSLSTQSLAGVVPLAAQVLCQMRIPVWLGPQLPSRFEEG